MSVSSTSATKVLVLAQFEHLIYSCFSNRDMDYSYLSSNVYISSSLDIRRYKSEFAKMFCYTLKQHTRNSTGKGQRKQKGSHN